MLDCARWKTVITCARAGNGSTAVVRALLTAGANLASPPGCYAALAGAVGIGQLQTVRVLLEAGAQCWVPTGTAGEVSLLARGVTNNQPKALHMVLQHAVNIGVAVDVDVLHATGEPAITSMTADTMRATALLLQHGADVNRYWGATSVRANAGSRAVVLGLPQALRLLLHHGLDANGIGRAGASQPLLHDALGLIPPAVAECDGADDHRKWRDRHRCVEVLLAAGADPFARDASGLDAITVAACNSVEALRMVLRAAAAHGGSSAAADGSGSSCSSASRLARRLAEPDPSHFEYRVSDPERWSAATARTVTASLPTSRRCVAVMHVAFIGHLHGVDDKVALLLEYGAAPCVVATDSAACDSSIVATAMTVLVNTLSQAATTEKQHQLGLQVLRAVELIAPHVPAALWLVPPPGACTSAAGQVRALSTALQSIGPGVTDEHRRVVEVFTDIAQRLEAIMSRVCPVPPAPGLPDASATAAAGGDGGLDHSIAAEAAAIVGGAATAPDAM